MKVDYHMHTNHSPDSRHSVSEVLDMVERAGLDVFAITDHDTISGVIEADRLIKRRKDFRPIFIHGIELSSVVDGMWLHFVGLGIDAHNKSITEDLAQMKTNLDKRMELLIDEIKKRGYLLDEELVKKLLMEKKMLGKPDLVEVMVNSDMAVLRQDAKEVLDLIRFPEYQFSPKRAIEVIKRAGGLAVLGHPVRFMAQVAGGKEKFEEMLKSFCDCGLDGIEVFTPHHNEHDIVYFEGLAKKLHLRVSGGSDFHSIKDPSPKPIGAFTDRQIRITDKLLWMYDRELKS